MSRALEYPSRCDRCKQYLEVGAEVNFMPDGHGGYIHIHPGEECPVPQRRARRRYDFRDCPRCGPWAYNEGQAPNRCHCCGSAWVGQELAA